MPFSSPRNAATSYLVLRHLADGDIIDWPLPDDHPLRPLFDGLEQQGYVARWDRMWPLSDRYRLTEKGIATLEAAYNPGAAAQVMAQIRAQPLAPRDRRAALQGMRLDPVVWPILHDPYTHWASVAQDQGPTYRWFWEDTQPPRRQPPPPKPAPAPKPARQQRGVNVVREVVRTVTNVQHHHHHHFHHDVPHHDPHAHHPPEGTVVDLDRDVDPDYIPPDPGGDADVS